MQHRQNLEFFYNLECYSCLPSAINIFMDNTYVVSFFFCFTKEWQTHKTSSRNDAYTYNIYSLTGCFLPRTCIRHSLQWLFAYILMQTYTYNCITHVQKHIIIEIQNITHFFYVLYNLLMFHQVNKTFFFLISSCTFREAFVQFNYILIK